MPVVGLIPIAALAHGHLSKLAAVAIVAVILGSALFLRFDEKDGSDGLFLFPLIAGTFVILALSILATIRLRRERGARPQD